MTNVLSPSQEKAGEAFARFLQDPFAKEFVLSGFAGSGKTYLLNHIIEIASNEYELARLINPRAIAPKFLLTATTNKAASVLRESVMYAPTIVTDAMTIHAALNLTVKTCYKTGKQVLAPKSKRGGTSLNNCIVVVDEASMISRELLEIIRKQTANIPCKILYVGDNYQLPPVKEQDSPVFNLTEHVAFLSEIQRQAQNSPIIQFSQLYRDMMDDPAKGFPEIPSVPGHIEVYEDQKAWEHLIATRFQEEHEPNDLRVLAWSNERVRTYNAYIRNHLGYTDPFNSGEIMVNNHPIIDGEDVVRLTTDQLVRIESYEEVTNKIEPDGTTVFNVPGWNIIVDRLDFKRAGKMRLFMPKNFADQRKILAILAKHKMWAEFWTIKNRWADLRPIHAQTVHKSQGSTYKEVFIDVEDIAKNNKWYEVARLMYVAITRASEKIHLYGSVKDRYNINKNPQSLMEKFNETLKI
jgi:hypothetical protein